MPFSLQKLNPRHFKILDLCLDGLQAVDIARHLKMTPTQINNIIRSPSFQHQFAVRRKQREDTQDASAVSEIDHVKNLLKENTEKAANKLIASIDSNDEKIAIKSASEILDRGGYPSIKEQRIQDNSVNIVINSEELSVLKDSLAMISAD